MQRLNNAERNRISKSLSLLQPDVKQEVTGEQTRYFVNLIPSFLVYIFMESDTKTSDGIYSTYRMNFQATFLLKCEIVPSLDQNTVMR